MTLKPEEIKNQFDYMLIHQEGYKKGYGEALQWAVNKLAKETGEKEANEDTGVETDKDVAKASK